MTVLHSGLRQRPRPGALDESDRADLHRLVDRDPIVNAVVSARLRLVGSLRPHLLGGTVVGVRSGRELVAACLHAGNLVPIGGDAESVALLARHLRRQRRVCTSIVGRADTVQVMWPLLAEQWGPARSIRASQPLLLCDGRALIEPDPDVRPATMAQFERYLPAAAAMFAEELGTSPHVAPGTEPFRSRIAELISAGRALASYDHRGQVIFKAEIGAVTPHTAQIQGVWVRPDLRRRGVGTGAMAAVINYAITLAPTVSLYVNDFNLGARRMYDRLGMREVATLATVLL